MSAEQYQRNINSLDKDIASLEKKKAEADKKCAELQKKDKFYAKKYIIADFCLYDSK